MWRYVFEDKDGSVLSEFFKKAYTDDIVANYFRFTGGNGRLVEVVGNLLCEDSKILVYMDAIPDNVETVKVYHKLRKMSMEYNYRIIVLPLVCFEYYMLKAIQSEEHLYKSSMKTIVEECLSKSVDYKSSPIITTEEDRGFVKNFEKYCKLIFIKDSIIIDCVRVSGIRSGLYYRSDCKCEQAGNIEGCKNIGLKDKSIKYVTSFPCFLEFPNSFGRKLSEDELWGLHRTLVNEYNSWCAKFKEKDRDGRYKTIPVIK